MAKVLRYNPRKRARATSRKSPRADPLYKYGEFHDRLITTLRELEPLREALLSSRAPEEQRSAATALYRRLRRIAEMKHPKVDGLSEADAANHKRTIRGALGMGTDDFEIAVRNLKHLTPSRQVNLVSAYNTVIDSHERQVDLNLAMSRGRKLAADRRNARVSLIGRLLGRQKPRYRQPERRAA